jgi:hypothetical protein
MPNVSVTVNRVTEEINREIELIAPDRLPHLLDLIRQFRQDIGQPPLEEELRAALDDVRAGRVISVEALWDRIGWPEARVDADGETDRR